MLALLKRFVAVTEPAPMPPPRPEITAQASATQVTVSVNLRWLERAAEDGDAAAARLLAALDIGHASGDWGGGDYPLVPCNQRNSLDIAAILERASRDAR